MIRIDENQRAAFSTELARSFEDRTLKHLWRFFPVYCDNLGEAGVRSLIQCGVDQAAARGFTTERSVCLYIDVMVLLGSDFDGRSDLSEGVREPLFSTSNAGQLERASRLLDAAFEQLRRARGISTGGSL